MNKLGEGISSQIEPVPAGYNLDEFASLMSELDHAMLTGKVSAPFVLGGLRAVLAGSLVSRDFPVWKTLVVAERDPTSYAHYLHEMGCNTILSHVARIPTVERQLYGNVFDLDIVRVSPKDVGFFNRKWVKRRSFYVRAQELGLRLAWLEVGLALRINYLDQPCGEWLTLSCGVNDHSDYINTHIRVGRGVGDFNLQLIRVAYDDLVLADQEFVFIRPREAPHGE